MNRKASVNLAAVLSSLKSMEAWYRHMTQPKVNRFIYEYDPVQQLCSMENCPIRELGSIWDLSNLSMFLQTRSSLPKIHSHLNHFAQLTHLNLNVNEAEKKSGYLKEEILGEPPNISHSAFLILSLISEARASRALEVDPPAEPRGDWTLLVEILANGILNQQREDGSYRIHFEGHHPDHGFELYSGEAMLAMVEAFKELRESNYLESVKKAFEHYSTIYYHGVDQGASHSGSTPVTTHRTPGISKEYLVFFANWMSQALSAFYLCTRPTLSQEQQQEEVGTQPPTTPKGDLKQVRKEMRHFVIDLHDRIVAKGYYEKLRKYPRFASTVEVACALEGICDALAILLAHEEEEMETLRESESEEEREEEEEDEGRKERYVDAVGVAVEFLLKVQKREGHGMGGFGYSLRHPIQRVDVTGHVANAFMKVLRLLIFGPVEETEDTPEPSIHL